MESHVCAWERRDVVCGGNGGFFKQRRCVGVAVEIRWSGFPCLLVVVLTQQIVLTYRELSLSLSLSREIVQR